MTESELQEKLTAANYEIEALASILDKVPDTAFWVGHRMTRERVREIAERRRRRDKRTQRRGAVLKAMQAKLETQNLKIREYQRVLAATDMLMEELQNKVGGLNDALVARGIVPADMQGDGSEGRSGA